MIVAILFLLVFATLIGASGLGWVYLLVVNRGAPLLKGEPVSQSPLGLLDVGIIFVIWIIGQFIGLGVLHQMGVRLSDSIDKDQAVAILEVITVCQVLSTALGLGLVFARYRTANIFSLQLDRWREDLILGLSAFVLIVPPMLLMHLVLRLLVDYSHDSLEILKENPNVRTLLAVWFAAVISAPICEEIFFRGILQRWLHRWIVTGTSLERLIAGGWDTGNPQSTLSKEPMASEVVSFGSDVVKDRSFEPTATANSAHELSANPFASPSSTDESNELKIQPTSSFTFFNLSISKDWMPIVLSSFLFAIVHVGQGLAPIPLFFMGLTLGYLFLKTNRLLPCIVLHAALNLFSTFWFTIGVFTEVET